MKPRRPEPAKDEMRVKSSQARVVNGQGPTGPVARSQQVECRSIESAFDSGAFRTVKSRILVQHGLMSRDEDSNEVKAKSRECHFGLGVICRCFSCPDSPLHLWQLSTYIYQIESSLDDEGTKADVRRSMAQYSSDDWISSQGHTKIMQAPYTDTRSWGIGSNLPLRKTIEHQAKHFSSLSRARNCSYSSFLQDSGESGSPSIGRQNHVFDV